MPRPAGPGGEGAAAGPSCPGPGRRAGGAREAAPELTCPVAWQWRAPPHAGGRAFGARTPRPRHPGVTDGRKRWTHQSQVWGQAGETRGGAGGLLTIRGRSVPSESWRADLGPGSSLEGEWDQQRKTGKETEIRCKRVERAGGRGGCPLRRTWPWRIYCRQLRWGCPGAPRGDRARWHPPSPPAPRPGPACPISGAGGRARPAQGDLPPVCVSVRAASPAFPRHIAKRVGSAFIAHGARHLPSPRSMAPPRGAWTEPSAGASRPTSPWPAFLACCPGQPPGEGGWRCWGCGWGGVRVGCGLRMTVIAEQGSSRRLISPILATKLINVIQHISRQHHALRYE